MKLKLKRPSPASGIAGQWLRGRSQATTAWALSMLMIGAVVLGVLGFVGAWLRPQPKPPKVRLPESTIGAEGIAESFVATWLRNGSQPDSDRAGASIAAYYPPGARLQAVSMLNPPPPVNVLRTATVAAKAVKPGYFAITVAADIEDPDGAVTRYYRVPILKVRDLFVAASLPAEVPAPLGARAPELAVGTGVTPNPSDPIPTAISRFLAALLTGEGELARYVSPGVPLRAIRPAPFVTVAVNEVGTRKVSDGSPKAKAVEAFVSATGTDAEGRQHPLQYPLRLVERAGRWEVSALLDAPTLATTQGRLLPPTTFAPPPSSTTPTTRPATTTTTTTTAARP